LRFFGHKIRIFAAIPTLAMASWPSYIPDAVDDTTAAKSESGVTQSTMQN
jgi:hypothetical protein